MIKQTDESHQDYESLVKALKTIETIVGNINESKRIKDNKAKLQELERSLDEEIKITDTQRWLIREGSLNIQKKGKIIKHNIFLFNDMLLIVKKRALGKISSHTLKVKAKIPISSVLVSEVVDNDNAFEIFYMEEKKKFTFEAENDIIKKEWINTIQKVIDGNIPSLDLSSQAPITIEIDLNREDKNKEKKKITRAEEIFRKAETDAISFL